MAVSELYLLFCMSLEDQPSVVRFIICFSGILLSSFYSDSFISWNLLLKTVVLIVWDDGTLYRFFGFLSILMKLGWFTILIECRPPATKSTTALLRLMFSFEPCEYWEKESSSGCFGLVLFLLRSVICEISKGLFFYK